MTSDQFLYWLQGFFEVSNSTKLSANQIRLIKNHLNMVFLLLGKRAHPFCHWLSGALEFYKEGEDCCIIQNKLNDCFEHVVHV